MTTAETALAAPEIRRQDRALLALGLPLVGSQIAQMLIFTTDTLMVGRYDITALAAISVAGPFFFIFFIVGAGFGWAVMPMVASAVAQNDARQVRRVTRMAAWLSVAYALIVMPIFFAGEPIFRLLGQDEEVARLGGEYLRIAAFSMPTALLFQTFRSYLSALEHTRIILWGTVAVAIANVVLNFAFVFGNLGAPEMGIEGAAVATVIVNLLFVLVVSAYIVRRTPEYDLFVNPHRPDGEALWTVFRLGWPIGLTSLAEVGLFSASSVMMGWVGVIPLAAHGVALQVASITFMLHLGLSQAITVRAGQAWGRTDRTALRSSSLAALILSGIAVLATIILFLTVPEFLVGLFVDADDPSRPAILVTGATLLAVAALFQFVDAAQVMALGMLRGVQDTRVPMVIAVITYWLIGLPVAYLLGFPAGLGGVGIWLGLTVGLAGAAILMQWRFWTRFAL